MLLPALNKARAASRSTQCLSNLRQMGAGWMMYLNDNKGHLPYIGKNSIAATAMWSGQPDDILWHGYWMGVLGDYKVNSSSLLCPEANSEVEFNSASGFGTAHGAWSGRWQGSTHVAIMLDKSKVNMTMDSSLKGYRIGSYAYNNNLEAGINRNTCRRIRWRKFEGGFRGKHLGSAPGGGGSGVFRRAVVGLPAVGQWYAHLSAGRAERSGRARGHTSQKRPSDRTAGLPHS